MPLLAASAIAHSKHRERPRRRPTTPVLRATRLLLPLGALLAIVAGDLVAALGALLLTVPVVALHLADEELLSRPRLLAGSMLVGAAGGALVALVAFGVL